MRHAATAAVLFALGFSVVLASSKSYDVVPYGNCVAEIIISPNPGVTQYFRNTLDSLTHISWWCGDTEHEPNKSGLFNVEVRDSAISSLRIAYAQDVPASQMWAWMDFPLVTVSPPVRGRTYRVHITRQDDQKISFAYDPRGPYKYGKSVLPSLPDTADLAMRVIGLYDTVDRTDFGLCLPASAEWYDTIPLKDTWSDTLVATGAGWATLAFDWSNIETQPDSYDWIGTDNYVSLVDTGIEKVGILLNTPAWASTARESLLIPLKDTVAPDTFDTTYDIGIHSAPRHLFLGVNDTANYYARWVDAVVHRDVNTYGDRIHTWLIWNEPNDTCSDLVRGFRGHNT